MEPSFEVIRELPLSSLSALCTSNKSWRDFCARDDVWQTLYLRDFGQLPDQKLSWKLEYLLNSSPTQVLTFGDNQSGQLGHSLDKTNIYVPTPILNDNLPQIVQIAASNINTYLLDNLGQVWGCGSNLDGQLGRPNAISLQNGLGLIPGLPPISQISAGGLSAFFLSKTGQVWAVGDSSSGQLGLGNFHAQTIPMRIPNLPQITQIACNFDQSFFLATDGYVWYCGSDLKQEGVAFNSPIRIDMPGVIRIYAGYLFNIILVANQKYSSSDLVDTYDLSNLPEPFLAPINWKKFNISSHRHLIISLYPKTSVAGANEFGQLGLGDSETRHQMVPNPDFDGAVLVSTGAQHTLVRKDDFQVYGCGSNQEGELGVDPKNWKITKPVQIPLTGFNDYYPIAIATGEHHSVILMKKELKITPQVAEAYASHLKQVSPGKYEYRGHLLRVVE